MRVFAPDEANTPLIYAARCAKCSDDGHKAINEEALRLGLKVTDPSRTVAGERLSNEQFHRYRATAGQLTAKGLTDLMATQAWRSMDDGKQRKAFDDMKADSRKAARETRACGSDEEGAAQEEHPGCFARSCHPVVAVQRDARSPARFCVGALNHVSIERPLWVESGRYATPL